MDDFPAHAPLLDSEDGSSVCHCETIARMNEEVTQEVKQKLTEVFLASQLE